MTCRTRRLVFLALLVVLVAFPIEALLVRVFWGERIGVASAERWVAVHAQSLPSSVVDVKALPFEYRKAVMAALPPASRAQLWQAHIDEYLQREALTIEQAEVLLAFRQVMIAENLTRPLSPDVREQVNGLSQRAKSAFDVNQFTEIFLQFGPKRVVASASAASLLTLMHLKPSYTQKKWIARARQRITAAAAISTL